MSTQLTSSDNNTNKNNSDNLLLKGENEIYPDTISELKKIEKEQVEKQKNLTQRIKEAEEQIKIEKKIGQNITQQKELELNIKKIELHKMIENNKRLKVNLHKLQVETNKKLDKIEMKEKNEVYEKEKEKRQSSLDILLKVKEKELINSLQIIEKKKKKKSNLEKILEKNVDMTQINNLYDKIRNAQNELDKLEKEKEDLEKIKEEHINCQKNQQKIIKEIETLKKDLKYIQMENRNKMNDERKYIYNAIRTEEHRPILRKKMNININISKSNELPLINNIIEEKKDKVLSNYEINEYFKKFKDIEKQIKIVDQKYNSKIKEIYKEKEDLEQKYNNDIIQIQEEEDKNKNLYAEVEYQKVEINTLQEKLNFLNKNVENKKKLFEEIDARNKNYIQKIKEQKLEDINENII